MYSSLVEIVGQLRWCGYECDAGKLEDNIAFRELEQMARYSHRNGETEPPTVEGWYFLKQHGNAKWAADPAHPLVSVIVMNRELTVWTWGNETPVKDIKGKWWGPVMLPWEQD